MDLMGLVTGKMTLDFENKNEIKQYILTISVLKNVVRGVDQMAAVVPTVMEFAVHVRQARKVSWPISARWEFYGKFLGFFLDV